MMLIPENYLTIALARTGLEIFIIITSPFLHQIQTRLAVSADWFVTGTRLLRYGYMYFTAAIPPK